MSSTCRFLPPKARRVKRAVPILISHTAAKASSSRLSSTTFLHTFVRSWIWMGWPGFNPALQYGMPASAYPSGPQHRLPQQTFLNNLFIGFKIAPDIFFLPILKMTKLKHGKQILISILCSLYSLSVVSNYNFYNCFYFRGILMVNAVSSNIVLIILFTTCFQSSFSRRRFWFFSFFFA